MTDMIQEFRVQTGKRDEMIDITDEVRTAVSASETREGMCFVFVPHTTAAVTINEGADPAVKKDILTELDRMVPHEHGYSHLEGNAAAHIKTTMVGSTESILVRDGDLVLGTWQSVFFCEFDGPRNRKVMVRVIPA